MNGRFGLAGISLIFAILSACGGGSGGNSDSTAPSGNATAPPGNSGGDTRPDNVAGFVYAVNRMSNDLSAFAINATTSHLTAVPGSPFATGNSPIAITVSPNGRFLYVTNAHSRSVSAYSIDDASGALSEIAGSPYPVGGPVGQLYRSPSSVSIDPSGKFAYVVAGGDYGAINQGQALVLIPGQIWAFSINATTGAWTPVPGSPYDVHNNRNPLAFDRLGKFAYASTNASIETPNDAPRAGAVITFAIDATSGALTQVGEPVVTAGLGQTPVTIHPHGNSAYIASDAGMASFSVDPNTGTLSSTDSPHGLTPYQFHTFRIAPSGKFVYASNYDPGRHGNGVAAFTVDASSGRLSEVAGSPYQVGMEYLIPSTPYPVTIDPSGRFVYMGTGGSHFCKTLVPCELEYEPGKIWAYAIDAVTGALSEIAGSPFSIETEPDSITFDPSGKAAYVLSRGDNNRGDWIYTYTMNNSTGALNPIGRVPTGAHPVALAIAGMAP